MIRVKIKTYQITHSKIVVILKSDFSVSNKLPRFTFSVCKEKIINFEKQIKSLTSFRKYLTVENII